MITITYDTKGRLELETLKAELDETRDIFWVNNNPHKINYTEAIYNPIKVSADGPELDFILDQFANIPIADGRTPMVWLGDYAKFITNNMTFALEDRVKVR